MSLLNRYYLKLFRDSKLVTKGYYLPGRVQCVSVRDIENDLYFAAWF